MTQIKVNATKGAAVANKKIELEIVKVIENPMAELETLDEREKDIIDVVKKSVKNLLDISQMRMFNEKEEGRMVGAHILMPVVVKIQFPIDPPFFEQGKFTKNSAVDFFLE